MSHPYQLLFRTPSLKQAYLSVLLSAIPLGTITLALVLSVESWTGSLSVAGSITALFTVGNAFGLTVQGFLIDRLGDRIVVVTAGLISGLTLGTVAAVGDDLSHSLLGVAVLIAGISVPAITTAVRRSLPLLTDDPAVRSVGYAALSVVFQLAFAVGPLLVSLTVLATGDAAIALLVAAVMIVTAAAIFAFAVPAQHPTRAEPSAPRPQIATLRPLLALYAVAACTGMATGLTTVAIPAVTQAAGLVVVAGIAFAASAVGDVTGAVVFGSRRWPMTERHQLRVALLAAACVATAVFLSSGVLWLLVLAIGVGGAIGAPVAIRLSSLLDELARPETLGRAYAILVSVGLVAAAAGTTLAGQLSTLLPPAQLLLGPQHSS
jgi:MFS family permease